MAKEVWLNEHYRVLLRGHDIHLHIPVSKFWLNTEDILHPGVLSVPCEMPNELRKTVSKNAKLQCISD